MAQLADARPDWQVVLVGPVTKIDEASVPVRPNIHRLGPKHYGDLPHYLGGWDVAWMPFARNEATRFISPTKTLEYLAGGRPVVSTPIRDVVRPYGETGLVTFPIHPRTRKNLEAFGLWEPLRAKVKAIEPVDYLDFIALLMGAWKVVTDSGGVQKEAYFFGVPCITLRDETEWIETVEDGWNAVVGTDTKDILDAIEKFNPAGTKSKSFGDGHAAEKIALILDKFV